MSLCCGGWSARSHQRPVGYLLLRLSLAHAYIRESKELSGATALGQNEVGARLETGHWAFTWSDADILELFEDTNGDKKKRKKKEERQNLMLIVEQS